MNVAGQEAEIHLTLEITRKETGNIETYKLTGKITEIEEKIDECDPHDSSP